MSRTKFSARQRLLARIAFFAIVIAVFVIALHSRWNQVQGSLDKLSPLDIIVAIIFGFGNIFTSMLGWRTLLRDIGSPLSLPVAMRVFFVGQLGKYLPGSVWTVVAQADLGRDHEIPPRRTVAVSVVAMGVSLAAALGIAALTLPFSAPGKSVHYWWAWLLLPVLVVGLMPSMVDKLTHLLLKILRREPPDHEFTWHGVVRALGWYTVSFLCVGMQVYVLAVVLHAPSGRALALALGGTALAFAAGFVAIFVPAGAIVREAVLVAVLSPVLDRGPALVIAVVSRLVATVGDGVFAAVALWVARHSGLRKLQMNQAVKQALAEPEHLPHV
ncbi:MAG: lysylphosphatidylglycerol synthase domain-containing protein [Acidothermaceae bacterium]